MITGRQPNIVHRHTFTHTEVVIVVYRVMTIEAGNVGLDNIRFFFLTIGSDFYLQYLCTNLIV